MEKVKAPISRRDQIATLSDENIDSLLAATKKGAYPSRDTAIMLFLLSTGARVAEVCDLLIRDIDFASRRVTLHGKGNKTRLVGVGKMAWRYLKIYLSQDEREATDAVFLSERGRKASDGMTRNGVFQLIERLKRAAGISSIRVSPHTFRHSFALRFLRAGGNVYTLMELLGHTSLTMSLRYLALAQSDIDAKRNHDPVDDYFAQKRKR